MGRPGARGAGPSGCRGRRGRALSGQRAALELGELVGVDGAAVEQLLGAGDLGGRVAAGLAGGLAQSVRAVELDRKSVV